MGVSWILSGLAAWPHSVASRYGRRPASFFFSFFLPFPPPTAPKAPDFFWTHWLAMVNHRYSG
jgi:hypothetical protein